MKFKNHLPSSIYKPMIKIYNKFINRCYQKSYSQEGEDLILYRILYGKIQKGFYVDVGAHHPKRFSNTYFFYKKGWNGINIEPMPGSKKIFDKYRPNDINIEIPISDKEDELTYYMFNDAALNGFSKEISQQRNEFKDYKIIKTANLKTRTLRSVLNEYLPAGQKIDVLSIDVEGLDLEVLKSNDWDKYKPTIILVEDKDFTFESPHSSDTFDYLQKMEYKLIAKTKKTLIFEKYKN
jgi:FkbM family methyltransferase